MVAEKRHPALLLSAIPRRPGDIARYGRQADSEAELSQFRMDLPRAPAILQRELTDKLSYFLGSTWSSWTTLRDSSPIQPKSRPMPSEHRVRLDDDQGEKAQLSSTPARPEPEQRNPEDTIERSELWLRLLLAVCGELLAQSKLDDRLLIPTSENGHGTTKEQRREIQQGEHLGQDPALFQCAETG